MCERSLKVSPSIPNMFCNGFSFFWLLKSRWKMNIDMFTSLDIAFKMPACGQRLRVKLMAWACSDVCIWVGNLSIHLMLELPSMVQYVETLYNNKSVKCHLAFSSFCSKGGRSQVKRPQCFPLKYWVCWHPVRLWSQYIGKVSWANFICNQQELRSDPFVQKTFPQPYASYLINFKEITNI